MPSVLDDLDLAGELAARRPQARRSVLDGLFRRNDEADDDTAPDALLRDGGRVRSAILDGVIPDEAPQVRQAMADAAPADLGGGSLWTLAEKMAKNPPASAANSAMYDFAGRNDRGPAQPQTTAVAAKPASVLDPVMYDRAGRSDTAPAKPIGLLDQPAQVLQTQPAAAPPSLDLASIYRGGTGQFRYGPAMDNGVVVDALYGPDGKRVDETGLPPGMQVSNARERAYTREIGAASTSDVDRQAKSLPLIDFPRSAERALAASQNEGQARLAAQGLDQANRKSLLDAALERERVAAQERIAKANNETQIKVAGDKKDRAEVGAIGSLFQNPAYLTADDDTKRQMEDAAGRAVNIFTARPATALPQAPPPVPGPAGSQPPLRPAAAGPDASPVHLTDPAIDKQVSSALERAKAALVKSPGKESGPAARPEYGYDTDNAGRLLDIVADPSLTAAQRQQVLARLAQTGGLDVQQLGDALVKAAVGSQFQTTPAANGIWETFNAGGKPGTLTSPHVPGLTVSAGGSAAGNALRTVLGGFNPTAAYDTASLYGRTVPLDVGDSGFRRVPLGIVESERHKARVRGAGDALGYLNQQGLYGERPLLGGGR